MPRTSARFAEVLQAVRAYALSEESGEVIQTYYRTCRQLADRLGLDSGLGNVTGYQRSHWDRFCGQVTRALNKLAEEGVLIKSGRGQDLPEGGRADSTRYYTPAAWAAAERRAQERRLADEEVAAAWEALRERLSALGITALAHRHSGLTMDLDSWTALTELAERAAVKP